MNAGKARSVAIMVGASVAWSTSGLFVRQVNDADALEMVFWRSIGMIGFLGAYMLWRYRRDTLAKIVGIGGSGFTAAALLASTFFFFLYAVSKTTVATALFLMSTSPFWAAVVARVFLRETLAARTIAAIGVCVVGVAIMVGGALEFGSILGPLSALCVSIAFAFQITFLRKAGGRADMVPSVLVAGLLSAAIAFAIGQPSLTGLHDILVLLAMGVIQLGLGCLLMTVATRNLSAADVGLIALLETTLGPFWVWLFYAERPADSTLLGGAIVLGALVANEVVGLRRRVG
ncbi:MAG: EamA family transporter [Alphaproteobacteria bacterium]|nr:EamA family transporter [Alphaproteobacteria bacterium]